MAKNPQNKGGAARIRFIMLEADLPDGDLSQITQAIQNAVKPSIPAPRLLQAPKQPAEDELILNDAGGAEDFDDDSIVDAAKPRTPRSSKPRVAKTPTVLDDIDLNSDPSLKDFVSQFDISTAVDKYLVIALWFRDARSTPSVSVDHVYTCFKILGWGTNSNDFAKPLRNLRDEQSMKGGAKEGYTLTLPGAGKIEAKKKP